MPVIITEARKKAVLTYFKKLVEELRGQTTSFTHSTDPVPGDFSYDELNIKSPEKAVLNKLRTILYRRKDTERHPIKWEDFDKLGTDGRVLIKFLSDGNLVDTFLDKLIQQEIELIENEPFKKEFDSFKLLIEKTAVGLKEKPYNSINQLTKNPENISIYHDKDKHDPRRTMLVLEGLNIKHTIEKTTVKVILEKGKDYENMHWAGLEELWNSVGEDPNLNKNQITPAVKNEIIMQENKPSTEISPMVSSLGTIFETMGAADKLAFLTIYSDPKVSKQKEAELRVEIEKELTESLTPTITANVRKDEKNILRENLDEAFKKGNYIIITKNSSPTFDNENRLVFLTSKVDLE